MVASEMLGKKFGRLVVVERNGVYRKKPKWLCRCDCGNTVIVVGASLRNGHTQSCGCIRLQKPNRLKHGQGIEGKRSKTYQSWVGMKARCDNPKEFCYKNYGGRGISYDTQWKNFENFFADMGECPFGKTLERIDNTLGYSKDNCCWASRTRQARNKRTTKLLTINGETKPLAEWAEILGVDYHLLYMRLRRGMPVSKAIPITVPTS